MKNNLSRKFLHLFLCVLVLGLSPNLFAQINSPASATVPFGSNTSYPGTVMLPTNLPNGSYGQSQDAADAYNQWKTDYVEACGAGKYRVKFDNASETVSEGIAYGMLIAAYAADKDLFDGLWQYYKDNSNGNGVMNWKIGGCSGVQGSGGATDAELDAAMALLVAKHQWPGSATPHDYDSDVNALINAIKDHEIQPANATGPYQTNNGDQWGFGNGCRNPSYQSPAYYKAYGEQIPAQSTFWDNVTNASYDLINANAHSTTGLVSNWSDPNGNSNSCNGPDEFGWDACRNPWRMAHDVAWYDEPKAKVLCNKMAAFLQGVGAANVRGPLPQDGSNGAYHSPAYVSTFALAVMGADPSYQNFLNQMYTESVNTMDAPPFYFGNTLRVLSLFMMTGNHWNPFTLTPPGPTPPYVTVTAPQDGDVIILGNTVDITADIYDADGTLTTIVFNVDNQTITPTNTSGNVYQASWTPTALGTYPIAVSATDNDGFTTTENLTITVDTVNTTPPPASNYNYAEVLQKSMYFYEAQRSGPLPADNRVIWRGNSGMDDGTDNNIDLTGGWYDAGDHVKFGFPMAFTSTMLAWSGVEDESAYQSTQQWEYLKDNVRWTCDYFMKCHVRDGNGNTTRFYGQVGNGSADHAWWGPAEVMQMDRPSYYVDQANPGSDLTGETAAALASAAMMFANEDPAYSAELLDHAIALYEFADTYRGRYSDAIGDATAFYNSWSGYNDELVWGAIWLYRATGDQNYLNDAIAKYADLSTEQGTNIKSFKWTLAWDDKSYGCYVLLSMLTGDSQYEQDAERWLDYWTDGYNGQRINYSPGGQAVLDTWGSLRYASNTSFMALLYADHIAASNPTKSETYRDFGISQINYALGDNPLNRSFVIGFGNNPPLDPHHRTAHGSWANSLSVPTETRHVLYGALVGGPSAANDQYTDDRSDYVGNEVATDYNAGFTGALAHMIDIYGGTPLANFPPVETPDLEYYSDVKINGSGNTYTEVSVHATNHSAWPAMVTENMCFRYFVDLSEGFNAGYSLNDYTVSQNGGGSTVSNLQQWDGTVYFVEVCFPGTLIYPGGQSESYEEAQVRIALPNNAPASAWDPSNDWSYNLAGGGVLNNAHQVSTHVPLYNDGVLLYGELPNGVGINNAPNALFTTSTTSGGAPLLVDFDATISTDPENDALTYAWNFGDGTSTTGATASHTFNTPGIYTVTLTVDDGNGNTDTATTDITVIDNTPTAPTAVITANTTMGPAPLAVNFSAASSSDVNGDPLTYTWDFGDGNTATGVSASNTYNDLGTYTVTLTVSDGTFTDTETVVITVLNAAPIANFTATPTSGTSPLVVNLDASASSDPNGDALTYDWDFGDGTTGTGATATHTYNNDGSYTIILTVTDTYGQSDSYSQGISVGPVVSCEMRLQYKTFDTNASSINDFSIRPHFIVLNEGTNTIPLSEVTIRYWYTNEGNIGQNVNVDYAQVGSNNILRQIVPLANPTATADNYLEIGFTNAAGIIAPGDNSGEIQVRIHKTDWSNYDESNDFSFNTTYVDFDYWDKIAVYRNGILVCGQEGGTGAPPINQAPNAVLTATPTTGAAPLAVSFDGAGSTDPENNALTYTWDFGDGASATGATAYYTYINTGTYVATLTVDDGNGGTDQTSVTIVVNQAPVNQAPTAVATANPTTGTAPLAVAFDGSGSTDPENDALTYTWDFGNGASAMGVTASYTYTNPGTYVATLTVDDGNGGTDQTTVTIVVTQPNTNQAPTAVATANPTTGTAPLAVSFDGSGSTDPENDALTYTWDFGNGVSATGATTSYTYTNPGTYTATLTVDDGNGGTDQATVTIVVNQPNNNQVPVAAIVANPTNGTAPLAVNFDGNQSSDPDGDALTYTWDFGNGTTASGATTSYTYTNTGTYVATLTVDDGNGGTAQSTITIVVTQPNNNQVPVAAIVANPTNGTAPLAVNFDGNQSSDPDGDALTYTWDFGNGTTASGATTSYTYTNPGTYVATLTVDDGNGGTAQSTITIVVTQPNNNQAPNAVIVANPTNGTAPLAVNFDGTNSTDPDGDALTYTWDFGNGTTASGATTSYTYTNQGTYTATLTVDDGNGGTHQTSVTIVVNQPNNNQAPNAVIVANPTNGTAPLAVAFDGTNSTDPDGDALTYTWDFGNGTTTSGPTSSYTYTNTGTYTATLTVDDGNGGTHQSSITIVVNQSNGNQTPNAAIVATPANGTAPLVVAFDGSQSFDPDGDALTYTWDFGNGDTGTGVTTSYTYMTPGVYVATLTVDDGNGGTAQSTITIVVNQPNGNQAPNAAIVANPTNGTAPLLVNFDGTNSTDPNGDALTYTWNFGNGTTASGATTSYTYTNPGTYTATLTVDDGNGGTNQANVTIVVNQPNSNQPPNAVIVANPTNGTAPLAVNFDGSNSSDPDGDALTYTWNFGNGTTASGATTSYTYTNPGTYTATLTVDDGNGGTHQANTTIVVNQSQQNQAPFVYFTNPQNNATLNAGNITLSAEAFDNDGNIASVVFSVDGQSFSGNNTGGNTYEANWNATPGTYNLIVMVYDNEGASTTDMITVTVQGNTGGTGVAEVEFVVQSSWNAGMCAQIYITNSGNAPITGWTLDFDMDVTINNFWNVNWSSPSTGAYTASDKGWNGTIQPGQTVNVGFCATHNGAYNGPQNGSFNGTPITIGYVAPNVRNNGQTVTTQSGMNLGGNVAGLRFAAYPTISNTEITAEYELQTDGMIQLSLFDLTGKQVAVLAEGQQTQGFYQLPIEVAQLAKGIYFLRLVRNEKVELLRIVVAE